MTLNHVKPHGALYGMAARQDEIAQRCLPMRPRFSRCRVYGMSGTLHETRLSLPRPSVSCGEFYADLDYAGRRGP